MMCGQARGKGYQVRLVRVSAWDSRVSLNSGNRRGRGKDGLRAKADRDMRTDLNRKAGRVAAAFMTAALICSICLSVLYFGLLPADALQAEKTAASAGTPDMSGEGGLFPGGESGDGIKMTQVSDAQPAEDMGSMTGPEPVSEEEPETPLIVLDPGHGGDDEGCMRETALEKEINLGIALRTADKLREMGFEVVLTREDNDSNPTLEERAAIAEEAEADIYVSIHQNACEEKESSAGGIETWYCGSKEGSRRLAQLVHRGALEETGAKERLLQETEELYVIRETSMPACLIETGFLSNGEERRLLCDPAYQDKIAAGIAQGVNYYFHPKTMYLTFDDGPSQDNTTAVLDILKEHNIKATFFVVGENVRKHPEVARRIVEEGHTIGIHCNKHEYDVIYASVDSYLEDFQEAYDAVYEVTGVEVKLFRFPGGSINSYNEDVYEEIIEEMTERGFIYFDWNGCLEDAVAKTTPEQLVENARKSTLGRKKVVMLAHDIVYNTTLCLEELIDSFPEYRFEPLTEDVKPIQF
ncbi:MAG: N-acetylmuramoyl-L-alanine amidase [Butyrivibrio sp.]|nr:N-acetylmuramoyl-L-alanine amidase [Acetatifactor muris]MCM1559949.1 N-acetylmuramoyl-L-alanine amidase [Butyrivibrio sp.]